MIRIPSWRSVRSLDRQTQLVVAILGLAIMIRIAFWVIWPPVWKVYPAFQALDEGIFSFVRDFQGYKPERMPIFNAINAVVFSVFGGVLGVKALTLFNLVLTSLSLPAFYYSTKHFFDIRTALAGLVLFAFYPKFIVMTVRGMPEAASAAFLALMLYSLARAQQTDSLWWYGTAGLFALASYLMFVPAVLVGILTTAYLFVRDVDLTWNDLFDTDRFFNTPMWVFSLPSLVVGLLYLAVGPLFRGPSMIDSFNSGKETFVLFVDPASYSFMEKIGRYLFYYHFDFWWHKRGFDQEDNVLSTFDLLQSMLDGLFPLYFIGWLAITGLLALLIGIGIYRLFDHDDVAVQALFLSWILLYVVVLNVRNVGWIGGFQSRHVFPIFPALCVAFGLGSISLGRYLNDGLASLPRVSPSGNKVLGILFGISFAALLLSATAHGVLQAENANISKEQPVEELTAIVEEGDTVAVVNNVNYRDIVIYSEGSIIPIRLDVTEDGTLEERSIGELTGSGEQAVSYIYIVEPCGDLSPAQQTFIDALLDHGGSIVYQLDQGGTCSVNGVIVGL